MSHAAIQVVVSPEEIAEHGGVEGAVRFNMAPFKEGRELFADGTRWDWYSIGGRMPRFLLGEHQQPVGELRRRLPELKAERGGHFPAPLAFLRRRTWQEQARMGWFGGEARTEAQATGKEAGRSMVRQESTEAVVITWNESREAWQAAFWERFVAPCGDDELAVVVDYHV